MTNNTKPLTTEAIALTEKKMDMTLDDIIKMSKPARKTKTRVPNKNPNVINKTAQDRSVKAKQFLASRSSMRQGALAKRRSNFQENQFLVTTAAARRVATAPARLNGFSINRRANWNNPRVPAHVNQGTGRGINLKGRFQQQQYQPPQKHVNIVPRQRSQQTLDSLFANMKQQRLKTQQNYPYDGSPFQFQQRQASQQNYPSDGRPFQFQQRRASQPKRSFQGGQQQQHGRGWFAN